MGGHQHARGRTDGMHRSSVLKPAVGDTPRRPLGRRVPRLRHLRRACERPDHPPRMVLQRRS